MISLLFTKLIATSFTNDQLGVWILIAILVLNGAGAVKVLFTKKPAHSELATKKQLESYVKESQFKEFKTEMRGDVVEIRTRIDGAMDKVEIMHKEAVEKVEDYAEKSYSSRKDIHKDLNLVERAQTALETRQAEQKDRIKTVEKRQDQHVEKVITQLTAHA